VPVAQQLSLQEQLWLLLPDHPVPLLKRRWELSREEGLRLWAEKRQQGWQICEPQWALAPERQSRMALWPATSGNL
jgi:hypothetical protein